MGEVTAFGVGDFSMRIWLDPERMQAREITPEQVTQAIREQNVQVPAGQIGEPPVPAGQAYQFTLNVRGRLEDPKEFGEIALRTNEEGGLLRLKDVADIELGASSYIMSAQLNGYPTASMAVYQIPGANAIDVVAGVRAKLKELEPTFPAGLEYKVIYDNTDVINASIKEVARQAVATRLIART